MTDYILLKALGTRHANTLWRVVFVILKITLIQKFNKLSPCINLFFSPFGDQKRTIEIPFSLDSGRRFKPWHPSNRQLWPRFSPSEHTLLVRFWNGIRLTNLPKKLAVMNKVHKEWNVLLKCRLNINCTGLYIMNNIR